MTHETVGLVLAHLDRAMEAIRAVQKDMGALDGTTLTPREWVTMLGYFEGIFHHLHLITGEGHDALRAWVESDPNVVDRNSGEPPLADTLKLLVAAMDCAIPPLTLHLAMIRSALGNLRVPPGVGSSGAAEIEMLKSLYDSPSADEPIA